MEYLDMGMAPLANSYVTDGELSTPEFREELAIRLCTSCGLSQLSKVVSPDRMFRNYLYVSRTPETFRRHCQELVATTVTKTGATKGEWVLDIASNDGYLLSVFRERGMNVVGVDPAENLAREANAAGIRTICAYWSGAIARAVVKRFDCPKIITATNVLGHVDDVHEFVDAVNVCLAPNGIFVVEVPYVLDFIEKNEFDTAYHEHLSYLGVHALRWLVEGHGLIIRDLAYFGDIHGGTIRVFVARRGEYPVIPQVARFVDRERQFGIKDAAPYRAFAARVANNKKMLLECLENLRREGKRIWAYGASAKGSTLVNYFGISSELVPIVIDDNPKKWGLYTPGTHMRVVGIEELRGQQVDYLLLLAWNFETEIRQRCRRAGYTGGFVVPVPEPRVVKSEGR